MKCGLQQKLSQMKFEALGETLIMRRFLLLINTQLNWKFVVQLPVLKLVFRKYPWNNRDNHDNFVYISVKHYGKQWSSRWCVENCHHVVLKLIL